MHPSGNRHDAADFALVLTVILFCDRKNTDLFIVKSIVW
jgi:hypothetical protein